MEAQKYTFPTKQETKRGTFFVHDIKFVEIVKDDSLDSESEIDIDFGFCENVVIPILRNNKQAELYFINFLN